MRMRGNLSGLGFTSEITRRAVDGVDRAGSIYVRAGYTPTVAPVSLPTTASPVATTAAPRPATPAPTTTGVTPLPPPIPHTTAARLIGQQQGAPILRVSPTAAASASAASGGSTGSGSGGGESEPVLATAQAKPGLPFGLLSLLAYALFG